MRRSLLTPLLPLLCVAALALLPAGARSLLHRGFFEFCAPAWTALSSARDVASYWTLRLESRHELIREGRDLARLNAALQLQREVAAARFQELQRLEELLGLPSHPRYRYVVARVAHRPYDTWRHRLVIRQGRVDGLRPGQGVVAAWGVVGRVREVHTYTAVVELVSSPGFRIAAHLENDLRPVTFQGLPGTPGQPPRGRLENVFADVETAGGQPRVVTSALGGIFPEGLALGRLTALEPADDGLFQQGRVALDPRLDQLREVAVLVPLADERNEPSPATATP